MAGRVVGTRAFPDHHRFSRAEMGRIERLAKDSGAEAMLVTEKDLVGLDWSAGDLPVFGLGLKGRWIDSASRDTMEAMLTAKTGL